MAGGQTPRMHTHYSPMAGDWLGWRPRSVEETVDAGVHPVVAKMRQGTFGLAKNPDGIDMRAAPWEKGREWCHGKEVRGGGYTYNRRNNAAALGGEDTDPKKQLERLSAMGVNPQDYLKMAKQLGVNPEDGLFGRPQDVSLPTSRDAQKDKKKKKGKKKRDKKKKKKSERKLKKKAGKKKKKNCSSSSSGSDSSGEESNEGSKSDKTCKSDKSGSKRKRKREADSSDDDSSDADEKEEQAKREETQLDKIDSTAVRMEGSPGSLWLSRKERCQKGWRDIGEPENAVMLEPAQPAVLVAAVAADSWAEGGQAGLYAIADARWWVKLVVESIGDGCRVVFAEQHMGVPFVRGAVAIKRPKVAIGLALSMNGSDASAEWRDEAGTWQPVARGVGWRERIEQQESELPAQPLSPLHFGDLSADDERRSDRAVCRLPLGWRAALMTESWPSAEKKSQVTFSEVAAVPAPDVEQAKQTAPAAPSGNELEF